MNPRQSRTVVLVAVLASVGLAAAFTIRGIGSNLDYYYPPVDIVARAIKDATTPGKVTVVQPKVGPGQRFRIGGLVADDSLQYGKNGLRKFVITDNEVCVRVEFVGTLPDLFDEGQTVLMTGALNKDYTFIADEVLAKHDENYDPPEVAGTLRKGAIDCKDESRFHQPELLQVTPGQAL